jgi:hypothetical protein
MYSVEIIGFFKNFRLIFRIKKIDNLLEKFSQKNYAKIVKQPIEIET